MPDMPKHEVDVVKRHKWIIGDGDGPLTARQLRDGIYFAQKDMESLGIDTAYDDAYLVVAEGYQIELIAEVEE